MIPNVSVVLLSYQSRPDWLKETIASLIAQQGVRTELVMSTVVGDPAEGVAKELGMLCSSNVKPGIYEQLNSALCLTSGEWFTVASAEDIYLPEKFITEIVLCGSARGVCYSDFYYAGEDLSILSRKKYAPYSYGAHLGRNVVPDDAMMHRRILDKYKPFRTEFGMMAFWDFWLRVAEGEGPSCFVHNPEPEFLYRQTQDALHLRRLKDKGMQREWNLSQRAMLAVHGGKPLDEFQV